MSPLVVVAAIAGAWFVLSMLAALWLAQLLGIADSEDGLADRPTGRGDPTELPRA